MKHFCLILIGVLLLCSKAQAQDFLSWQYNDRYFTVSSGLGYTSYLGELKHDQNFQKNISVATLGLEARLLPKFAARAEASWYQLSGDDRLAKDSSIAQQRNLSFTANNLDLTVSGVFFMKKYREAYHKRPQMDPYLAAGIGLTRISPTAELTGQKFNLFELETEGKSYSRLTLIVPLRAGLKFRVTPYLNFIGEFSYQFTFSDYLDDVSGNYPESYNDLTTSLLSNRKEEVGVINQEAYDTILIAGGPRGNPDNKDAYMTLTLKLEYYLPPGLLKKK